MPVETSQLEPDITVVSISGRLTLGRDVERLDTLVVELIKQDRKRFVFDVSTMDYADSAGIGTLVSCLTNIKKAGGDLRVAGANPRVQRLLQMTGVDTILAMYPTVAEAAAG